MDNPKNILLIHGPNLNLLGQRQQEHYGDLTLKMIEDEVESYAALKHLSVVSFHSNHEGHIIDFIQSESKNSSALIINAGALTHYSYALHDAILDCRLPTVEVHLSDIQSREPWRAHSVIKPACIHSVMGKKEKGYIEAIDYLSEYLSHEH